MVISPAGLKTPDGFFMVGRGMTEKEKVAMAVFVYAVGKSVLQCLHVREGLRGSSARKPCYHSTQVWTTVLD